ncbi:MAG: 3-isopropylmalate dehydratase large subunit, partial [Acidobacteria bacterium]|nr:3-isopropylmalate dehydratase large subunit [Acidobacteriota bacterium]
PRKVTLVNDHFVPAKDIKSAELSKAMREFAREYEIPSYFEIGRSGICHTLLPEQGLVAPGELVIGADSHTCTYGALGAFSTGVGSTDMAAAWALGETWLKVPETIRIILHGKPQKWVVGKDIVLRVLKDLGVDGARYQAIEYEGGTLQHLSQTARFTICNMAIEAGAKSGIMPADEITDEFCRGRVHREYIKYRSDDHATYARTLEYDISELTPQVAVPFLPSNVVPVESLLADKIRIDQVFIGSCTNGMLEDLREAARVLRGKKVHPAVRMIVIPATQGIYLQADKEGLIADFVEAGAVVGTATCGPCLGGYMGVLASGERAVATTNRNFHGRMGHASAEVYLASPVVAAASAILGRVAHPEELET